MRRIYIDKWIPKQNEPEKLSDFAKFLLKTQTYQDLFIENSVFLVIYLLPSLQYHEWLAGSLTGGNSLEQTEFSGHLKSIQVQHQEI